MDDISRAEKARLDIRTFRIIADALLIRGYYKLGGKIGQKLERTLRSLSPEIYGTMNDPRIAELNGLQYIVDRLPRGIEECGRIVLMAREDLDGTSFEKIVPAKRRRTCYRVAEDEMSFAVTRGMTEIYDILTHVTFLYIEAKKIHDNMTDEEGNYTKEWRAIEAALNRTTDLDVAGLDQIIWNLSVLLGRTYNEVKEIYTYLEKSKNQTNACNDLLHIIYNLGKGFEKRLGDKDSMEVRFTPSLTHTILHQAHGKKWASAVRESLASLGLLDRPLHIISANLHSVVNLLYGFAANTSVTGISYEGDFYSFMRHLREEGINVADFAGAYGFHHVTDSSGANIDFQIIDTSKLETIDLHPSVTLDRQPMQAEKPVLLVMDYAFGTQAFELMDELLNPENTIGSGNLEIRSVSVMGKAGTLAGKKGDIMLASAHVLEGVPHIYMVDNDLELTDFDQTTTFHQGPIITVLGTSLQNSDVLERFLNSSWRAIGLEMEGGHYQRAVNAAIIRGHIPENVKVRYAYYASDNPLMSGMTLASGSLGWEGLTPTYNITKAIVQKILGKN